MRVSELEARLSKDRHNSSKPPSSDGLKKTRSLRRPSGAKPGGQVGHKGTTLKRVQEPDEVIEHGLPERCDGCGETLPPSCAQIAERRQVFDIPVVRYEATEHRILRLQCGCGKLHESQFLSSVRRAVQYEPNIHALVVHADESGLRVASCLHWLHTAASETHTWYGEHARRGMEAIECMEFYPDEWPLLCMTAGSLTGNSNACTRCAMPIYCTNLFFCTSAPARLGRNACSTC